MKIKWNSREFCKKYFILLTSYASTRKCSKQKKKAKITKIWNFMIIFHENACTCEYYHTSKITAEFMRRLIYLYFFKVGFFFHKISNDKKKCCHLIATSATIHTWLDTKFHHILDQIRNIIAKADFIAQFSDSIVFEVNSNLL